MDVLVISNAPHTSPKSTAAVMIVGEGLERIEEPCRGRGEGDRGVGAGAVIGPSSILGVGGFGVGEDVPFPLFLEGE